MLITQRSLVQIQPPQPFTDFNPKVEPHENGRPEAPVSALGVSSLRIYGAGLPARPGCSPSVCSPSVLRHSRSWSEYLPNASASAVPRAECSRRSIVCGTCAGRRASRFRRILPQWVPCAACRVPECADAWNWSASCHCTARQAPRRIQDMRPDKNPLGVSSPAGAVTHGSSVQ